MHALARGLGLALAGTLLVGCPHVAPTVMPGPGLPVVASPPLERDPILRVHHHWAECREGIFGDLTVTVDGHPCLLAPGEVLAVALTPGEHAVALTPDRTPGLAEAGPMVVPMREDRDLHVGCHPHALHRGYLVPLILTPDGPSGFSGRVVAGGVEVEVQAGQRTIVLLPRGDHRVSPRGGPGCPATTTTVTLAGGGALVLLGPCGEARATPPPALVPATRRCDFSPPSVGSPP